MQRFEKWNFALRLWVGEEKIVVIFFSTLHATVQKQQAFSENLQISSLL
jgi:hypothetical protein